VKGTNRVIAALREAGVHDPEVRRFEDTAKTAVAAAAAIGCEVGAIASSLLFFTDDGPVLVMTSGRHRVDEARLGVTRRATADEVKELTGYSIGGVSPVGHPAPLRTLVDVALQDYDEVWAAAGHPHAVFRTSYDELVTLTQGTPAVVGD
jgi:prolyl-tRNA editing enzyme YbaK/EbsC (Cys-tRNA(Pro) deacylase)